MGVEAVTPEGLKAIFKDFNCSGESLVQRLQTFRAHDIHVLGSFIFGLPTDRPDTFDATAELAQRAGITFAQFVMLTPFPGTVDFERWEKAQEHMGESVNGIPLTRYWLIPPADRPKMFTPHSSMTADEIRERTQHVWDDFYSVSSIWKRSRCVSSIRARLAFLFVSLHAANGRPKLSHALLDCTGRIATPSCTSCLIKLATVLCVAQMEAWGNPRHASWSQGPRTRRR